MGYFSTAICCLPFLTIACPWTGNCYNFWENRCKWWPNRWTPIVKR